MRTSSSCSSGLKSILLYLSLGVLVCLLVLPIVAIGLLQRLLGAVVAGLAASIGNWFVLCLWLSVFGAYLIWLLLCGEWCELLPLLPRFVDLLGSTGLL
jgi:hypothetical protein